MKLCVNYVMELRELFEEEKIDYVDYIKLYSINNDLTPFDWCVSKKNVMFHGLIGKSSDVGDIDFLENRDFESLKTYYERGKTPYISIHIARHTDNDTRTEKEIFEDIKKNVQKLKDILGMRVILENVPPSRKHPENYFLSNPEFISRIISESDAGFLFDIGHARVAAEVLEIPFDEYVSRLPMDKVVEMHLAGSMLKLNGNLVANHSKMNEEDYDFLKKAIKLYPTIETITLEYGPMNEYELQNDCVIISADKVNEIAKKEVFEQLERIHAILLETKK